MVQCGNEALWRYTWPGRDEQFCCEEHKQQILGVAEAMGFHLQMQLAIEPGSKKCENMVKEEQ
jgi:hypothetical protein